MEVFIGKINYKRVIFHCHGLITGWYSFEETAVALHGIDIPCLDWKCHSCGDKPLREPAVHVRHLCTSCHSAELLSRVISKLVCIWRVILGCRFIPIFSVCMIAGQSDMILYHFPTDGKRSGEWFENRFINHERKDTIISFWIQHPWLLSCSVAWSHVWVLFFLTRPTHRLSAPPGEEENQKKDLARTHRETEFVAWKNPFLCGPWLKRWFPF